MIILKTFLSKLPIPRKKMNVISNECLAKMNYKKSHRPTDIRNPCINTRGITPYQLDCNHTSNINNPLITNKSL